MGEPRDEGLAARAGAVVSWQAVQFVLEHSKSKGATRLVFVCLAERMNKGGANAWPSAADLSRRSKHPVRVVRRCVSELRKLREIEQTGLTERGVPIYQLGARWVADVKSGGDDISTGVPGQDVSPGMTGSQGVPDTASPEPPLKSSSKSSPKSGKSGLSKKKERT